MQQNIRSNFDMLRLYEPQLWRLCALAERHFAEDPNTSLLKLRQFAELLAQSLAARKRASYGGQLLDQLGPQLSHEFGCGFEARHLPRMVKLAQAFPDAEIVSTLSTKLSSAMSHISCPCSG